MQPTAASSGALPVAPTTPGPKTLDQTKGDNPAGLGPTEVAALLAGGPLEGMRWLYPYEGTVMPRTKLPPVLMWSSAATPDAVYLRIKSQSFEYKGILKPSAEAGLVRGTGIGALAGLGAANSTAKQSGTQLAIPNAVWEQMGEHTRGKHDPFTLELTERVGSQIHGPITARIVLAQVSFRGSLYYNSCASAIIDASATDPFAFAGSNGEILRIPPTGRAELVLKLDHCHGCHSVSADGSRLLAQQAPTQGQVILTQNADATRGIGLSFALGPDGRVVNESGTRVAMGSAPGASYGALYPDGSAFLTTAVRAVPIIGDPSADPTRSAMGVGIVRSWGYAPDAFNTAFDFVPARLYETQTGKEITDSGVPDGALMPSFSPDGRLLVFNDDALDAAHGLALMDYDTHAHKARNYRVLTREPANSPLRPGWPFVLPDNAAVIFARTNTDSFTSDTLATTSTACTHMNGNCGVATAADGGTPNDIAALQAGKPSDLYIVDVATGRQTLLARAMGFDQPADAEAGRSYLPFGEADMHHNYFPTVSPVAAGGYFWAFFDSRRNFGSYGLQRAIWGFAIDIQPDGNYALDPSHPPFYLSGQEFGTSSSNHRAFAALDRCRPDAQACAVGIDCCSGHCDDSACAPAQDGHCSPRDARCVTRADCCDPNDACINGFCAWVSLD